MSNSLFLVHWSPVNPWEQAHVPLATQAPFSHGGSHVTTCIQGQEMVYTWCNDEPSNNVFKPSNQSTDKINVDFILMKEATSCFQHIVNILQTRDIIVMIRKINITTAAALPAAMKTVLSVSPSDSPTWRMNVHNCAAGSYLIQLPSHKYPEYLGGHVQV